MNARGFLSLMLMNYVLPFPLENYFLVTLAFAKSFIRMMMMAGNIASIISFLLCMMLVQVLVVVVEENTTVLDDTPEKLGINAASFKP